MAVIELVMEPVASKGAVAEATKVAEKAAEAPKAEAPKAEAAEGLPAGSHAPLESGEAPEGFEVKGNSDSMKYHVPGSRWYSSTKAEIWFDSAGLKWLRTVYVSIVPTTVLFSAAGLLSRTWLLCKGCSRVHWSLFCVARIEWWSPVGPTPEFTPRPRLCTAT